MSSTKKTAISVLYGPFNFVPQARAQGRCADDAKALELRATAQQFCGCCRAPTTFPDSHRAWQNATGSTKSQRLKKYLNYGIRQSVFMHLHIPRDSADCLRSTESLLLLLRFRLPGTRERILAAGTGPSRLQ